MTTVYTPGMRALTRIARSLARHQPVRREELGLLILGLAIFLLNGVIGIFLLLSPAIFLLPLIPIRLAYPGFRARLGQTGMEVLLALAAVVLALTLPAPEMSWSSPFTHAGAAAAAGLIIVFWAQGFPRRSTRLRLNNGAVG